MIGEESYISTPPRLQPGYDPPISKETERISQSAFDASGSASTSGYNSNMSKPPELEEPTATFSVQQPISTTYQLTLS